MPSKAVLEEKKQLVAELSKRISESCAGVIVDYKGISVADDTKLRADLRKEGVEYTVVKNTLLHLAIDGTDLADLDKVLEGTTAIATSKEDNIAPARILCKYAESNDNFKIKAGFLDGKVIDLATLDALAKLPSREVLLATVCNVFNAPISAFARAIQAVADKKAAEGDAPVEEKVEAAAPVEEAKAEEAAPAEEKAEEAAPAEEAKAEESAE
ncbi:MAG: 50S ribosomal protein L10 [Clostridiales bacterium]|nr:50S ribosomal protein L10 [Clostridiales bacterium]